MTKFTKDQITLACYMARGASLALPHEITAALEKLLPLARRHARLCLLLCNEADFVNGTGEHSRSDGMRGYEVVSALEDRINALMVPYIGHRKGGCGVSYIVLERDPRARSTVKFRLSDGRSNDMGGEEWCL
jgi:hypothetical protein